MAIVKGDRKLLVHFDQIFVDLKSRRLVLMLNGHTQLSATYEPGDESVNLYCESGAVALESA
jgi:hypothetical protein